MLEIGAPSGSGVHDGAVVVGGDEVGTRRPFPQRRCSSRRLSSLLCQARGIVHGLDHELGGRRVAQRRPRRRARPLSPLGSSHQHRERLFAGRRRVDVVGYPSECVEVVAGDHLGDLLAVVGEGLTEVGGDGEVPRLSLAKRKRLVGDLAQQLLGEAVVTALGRERVGGHLENVAAHELVELRPHLRLLAT